MRLRDFLTRKARDENGAILVFWAFALAAMLGLAALSFDLGRIASTQSELQSFADNVALAAAGELDGQPDSIDRATEAAQTLIADSQTFGQGGRDLSGPDDYTLTFFTTLPPSDQTALAATGTNDPRRARYVRVTVTERTVDTPFAAAMAVLMGNVRNAAQVGATAVAGYSAYACDITPLMFCVPSGWQGGDAERGNMILLRTSGQGAGWGPGNFGFLDPTTTLELDGSGPCAGLNGAQLYRCLVGAEGSISSCVRTDAGVDTDPGQANGLRDAFNIRFDIYPNSMSNKDIADHYRPAPNVIKGRVRNNNQACITNANQSNPSPNTISLPRDNCFASGSCAQGNRFGNGNWNRNLYVSTNHNGVVPSGFNMANGTRYEMYLAEIAQAAGGPILPAGKAENRGLPACEATPSSDPDRRVVIAAAIDCGTYGVQGRARNVPVQEYVRLFITEPVGLDSPSSMDFYVEVVGTAGRGDGSSTTGVFQDFVQLYR